MLFAEDTEKEGSSFFVESCRQRPLTKSYVNHHHSPKSAKRKNVPAIGRFLKAHCIKKGCDNM